MTVTPAGVIRLELILCCVKVVVWIVPIMVMCGCL